MPDLQGIHIVIVRRWTEVCEWRNGSQINTGDEDCPGAAVDGGGKKLKVCALLLRYSLLCGYLICSFASPSHFMVIMDIFAVVWSFAFTWPVWSDFWFWQIPASVMHCLLPINHTWNGLLDGWERWDRWAFSLAWIMKCYLVLKQMVPLWIKSLQYENISLTFQPIILFHSSDNEQKWYINPIVDVIDYID